MYFIANIMAWPRAEAGFRPGGRLTFFRFAERV